MSNQTADRVTCVPRDFSIEDKVYGGEFFLPLEGVVLIMGVDEFMDMGHTTINLIGNCVATVFASHWLGEKLARRSFRSIS